MAKPTADVSPTTNTTSKGQRHSVSTHQPTATPPTSPKLCLILCHLSVDTSMAKAF